MVTCFSKVIRAALSGAALTLAGTIVFLSAPAVAHQTSGEPYAHVHTNQQRTIVGERYTPTIWVDPDGCEHWVMDDGWEGFMTLKVDRNGKPSCRGGSVCATLWASKVFHGHGTKLSSAGKRSVANFFQQTNASAYKIIGHTDIGGSDMNNVKLSTARAQAVANIAKSAGARIVGIDGYGGRAPMGNSNGGNWKKNPMNHRIEVICLR